ncbi:hypothetical protein TKWG_16180 [Advenella kashmirensis WT001]|uniref:Uncharacterized protein n=1 Tax=Advenella kashmirensis (strain DSM 17095 / LMG 22695 / WT001) TaxID=1036672 RepID=I3UDV9_ADVKW|nr:hypothetical protein [Advenella kashmirensis]AFK63197.1 hypothetical protein TKWG_16180 [Advenella kashmirensis WT001]
MAIAGIRMLLKFGQYSIVSIRASSAQLIEFSHYSYIVIRNFYRLSSRLLPVSGDRNVLTNTVGRIHIDIANAGLFIAAMQQVFNAH